MGATPFFGGEKADKQMKAVGDFGVTKCQVAR
jgi:hypothetical protein